MTSIDQESSAKKHQPDSSHEEASEEGQSAVAKPTLPFSSDHEYCKKHCWLSDDENPGDAFSPSTSPAEYSSYYYDACSERSEEDNSDSVFPAEEFDEWRSPESPGLFNAWYLPRSPEFSVEWTVPKSVQQFQEYQLPQDLSVSRGADEFGERNSSEIPTLFRRSSDRSSPASELSDIIFQNFQAATENSYNGIFGVKNPELYWDQDQVAALTLFGIRTKPTISKVDAEQLNQSHAGENSSTSSRGMRSTQVKRLGNERKRWPRGRFRTVTWIFQRDIFKRTPCGDVGARNAVEVLSGIATRVMITGIRTSRWSR